MAPEPKFLYVALYPGSEAYTGTDPNYKYHWAFLVGPEHESGDVAPGMLYHVKNHILNGWGFEGVELKNVCYLGTLLCRIVIANAHDEDRVIDILKSVPLVQGRLDWKCFDWFVSAMDALKRDAGPALGNAFLDWAKVAKTTTDYTRRKTDRNRYRDPDLAAMTRPTWSMLEDKETHL